MFFNAASAGLQVSVRYKQGLKQTQGHYSLVKVRGFVNYQEWIQVVNHIFQHRQCKFVLIISRGWNKLRDNKVSYK